MLILCLPMPTRISRRLSQRAGVTRRKLANEAEPTIPSAPGAPRNRNHRCAPVPWSSSDSSTLGVAEERLAAAVRLQVPGPRIKAQWKVRRPRHRQGRNIPVQLVRHDGVIPLKQAPCSRPPRIVVLKRQAGGPTADTTHNSSSNFPEEDHAHGVW